MPCIAGHRLSGAVPTPRHGVTPPHAPAHDLCLSIIVRPREDIVIWFPWGSSFWRHLWALSILCRGQWNGEYEDDDTDNEDDDEDKLTIWNQYTGDDGDG